ncbi:hypothetical protein SK128_016693, partial [Halocaridina rubra]
HPGWGFPLGYHPWLDSHLSALGYNLGLTAFNPLAHTKALELARVGSNGWLDAWRGASGLVGGLGMGVGGSHLPGATLSGLSAHSLPSLPAHNPSQSHALASITNSEIPKPLLSGESRCLRCRGCESGGPCTSILHHSSPISSSSPSTIASSSTTTSSSSNSTSSSSTNSITHNSHSTSISTSSSSSSISSRPPPLAPIEGFSAFSIPRSLGVSKTSFPSRDSSFQPVKPSSERSPETK